MIFHLNAGCLMGLNEKKRKKTEVVLFYAWNASPFIDKGHRKPLAAFLLCHISQTQLSWSPLPAGQSWEAPSKGAGLAVSAAQNRAGLLLAKKSMAAKHVPSCLAHSLKLSVHLRVLGLQYQQPLQGVREAVTCPRLSQEDCGRATILHKVIKTCKSHKAIFPPRQRSPVFAVLSPWNTIFFLRKKWQLWLPGEISFLLSVVKTLFLGALQINGMLDSGTVSTGAFLSLPVWQQETC